MLKNKKNPENVIHSSSPKYFKCNSCGFKTERSQNGVAIRPEKFIYSMWGFGGQTFIAHKELTTYQQVLLN